MSDLRNVIDSFALDGQEWIVEAPAAWAQGRTLYGGMTAALCHAAAVKSFGADLPQLRSAQIAFLGPATGQLRFAPTILRQGRSATIVAVDCRNEAGMVARTTFIFGAARESRIAWDGPAPPSVPAPDACERFNNPKSLPEFAGNFEMRLAGGQRPGAGGDPQFSAWVRFASAQHIDPTTAILALGDALPPGALVLFTERAPISSMNWTIDLCAVPTAPDGWFLMDTASEQIGDGYALQYMRIWDASGRAVAFGRQVVAIFG